MVRRTLSPIFVLALFAQASCVSHDGYHRREFDWSQLYRKPVDPTEKNLDRSAQHTTDLRARAWADLKCEKPLVIEPLSRDPNAYEVMTSANVTGCGRHATYVLQHDVWMLNSPI